MLIGQIKFRLSLNNNSEVFKSIFTLFNVNKNRKITIDYSSASSRGMLYRSGVIYE